MASQRKKKSSKKEDKEQERLALIQSRLAELEQQGQLDAKESGPLITDEDRKSVESVPQDLREKYLKQLAKTRTLELQTRQLQKKVDALSNERDSVIEEMEKTTASNTKLEELCRSLQLVKNQIVDDVRARGQEEQVKRKELSEQFTRRINEITAKMEEQAQERLQMAEENDSRRTQIDKIRDIILEREEVYKKKLAEKEASMDVVDKQLKDHEGLLHQEESKFEESQQEMEEHNKQEEELRLQLHLYSEKFEEFQTALQKSTVVFPAIRSEMERMAKRIKALEHENQQLQAKTIKGTAHIIEINEERSRSVGRLATLEESNAGLQESCKNMQQLRAAMRAMLNPPEATAE